jgi:hypothetical protein
VIPFEWLQKNWVFARAARICVPSPGISGRAFRFGHHTPGNPAIANAFLRASSDIGKQSGSGEDLELSYLVPPKIVLAALDDPRRSTHRSACPQRRSNARWPMPAIRSRRPRIADRSTFGDTAAARLTGGLGVVIDLRGRWRVLAR